MLTREKILITGPTSQVAFPLAEKLAKSNEVYGLARLSKQQDRDRLESIGVQPLAVDLAEPDLGVVPDDVTLVLNFAVVKTGNFDYDMAANVEGLGHLMHHCRRAKALLHCSSGAVYEYAGHKSLSETDPLGDNHRVMFPTYSICKIAAESMARYVAQQWKLPTTIARFSVPYGDNGGWPWFHLLMMNSGTPIVLHSDRPNIYNPIHEDDYIRQIPKLIEIASTPATVLNWGGSEEVSIEDWCAYLGELTGLEPKFEYTDRALGSLRMDMDKMHRLLGKTEVPWREGIQRLVRARNPELLKSS